MASTFEWPSHRDIYHFHLPLRSSGVTYEEAERMLARQRVDEALAAATSGSEIAAINLEIYRNYLIGKRLGCTR